ncbi:MAG: U32 family peptidase [Gammaproteobacteria bacterium]|nr:U32 family peptidase [Gammaproteobacteria bacterium]
MILAEIKGREELNTIKADGYIINISSFSYPSLISIPLDEALEIIKESDKPIFVKLMPMYKTSDYPKLTELFKSLKGVKGIIFQDLGLVPLKNKYLKDALMIYDSNNFITTSEDYNFFKGTGVDILTLSTTLSLSELDSIMKNINYSYMAHVYGYIEMFYSKRMHFTNYSNEYNHESLKGEGDLSLKEETRDVFFKTIEDEEGFHIYRDKCINLFDFKDHFSGCEYLMLDRIFIEDCEYYDSVNLFNGSLDRGEYVKKYSNKFDTGFLFKIVRKTVGE